MRFFTKVANFVSGGIGGKIVDKILDQFPDKLTPTQAAAIEAAVIEETRDHERKLLDLANEQDAEFNARIKAMEGTAKDLQQFGWIGRVIIFLRGAQRSTWGYGVLFMDFKVFSGSWTLSKIAANAELESAISLVSAFWVMNLLVLGFLFGERAIKNLLPIIERILLRRQAQ